MHATSKQLRLENPEYVECASCIHHFSRRFNVGLDETKDNTTIKGIYFVTGILLCCKHILSENVCTYNFRHSECIPMRD